MAVEPGKVIAELLLAVVSRYYIALLLYLWLLIEEKSLSKFAWSSEWKCLIDATIPLSTVGQTGIVEALCIAFVWGMFDKGMESLW